MSTTPHQPTPAHVREAADAVEQLAAGEFTLAEVRQLVGDEVLVDGLLGVCHVLMAYLIQAGRDEATIWPAVRALVDRAA